MRMEGWFLRALGLSLFGHLIVVVFPSIKIYSLLILLLVTSDLPKNLPKTASVIMYIMKCKSLLLNSLYTITITYYPLSAFTIVHYNRKKFHCILPGINLSFSGLTLYTTHICVYLNPCQLDCWCFTHESSYTHTHPDFTPCTIVQNEPCGNCLPMGNCLSA